MLHGPAVIGENVIGHAADLGTGIKFVGIVVQPEHQRTTDLIASMTQSKIIARVGEAGAEQQGQTRAEAAGGFIRMLERDIGHSTNPENLLESFRHVIAQDSIRVHLVGRCPGKDQVDRR